MLQKSIELIIITRNQYQLVFSISIAITVLTGIMYMRNAAVFEPFLGKVNPILIILTVILLGIILLAFLQARGWFAIYKAGNFEGLLIASDLAALLGSTMILIDLKAVFPADINTQFPDSLLFYPVIGYVVEAIFHLLPLSLFLLVLTSRFSGLKFENIILPCILIVAIIEPIFQTAFSLSRPYPAWLVGYVFLHIFVINVFQLLIFKRYDFVSMYSFRLVYYMIWHIAWGQARLRSLF